MKNNLLIIISFLNFAVNINCNSQTATVNTSVYSKKIDKWEVNEKANNSHVAINLEKPDRPLVKNPPVELEQITVWNPFEDKKVKLVVKDSPTSNDWKFLSSNQTYTLQSNQDTKYTIYTGTAVCTGDLAKSNSYEIYFASGKFCIKKK